MAISFKTEVGKEEGGKAAVVCAPGKALFNRDTWKIDEYLKKGATQACMLLAQFYPVSNKDHSTLLSVWALL